mgnify:CR=1 FL=1|tara:strand:+ start:362 stop:529 length:168 start_codon:yes stop_codon:yes gene_type:complete
MNIESAKYIAYDGNNTSVNAVIEGVQYAIPMNTANRHYQAILEWVEDGNTIEDAD